MTLDPTMLLYTYISRFSVTPHYIKSGRVAATNAVPQPFLIAVSTSPTNGPRSLSQAKVGTHTRLSEKDRTQRLTRRNTGLPDGAASMTALVELGQEAIRSISAELHKHPAVWMFRQDAQFDGEMRQEARTFLGERRWRCIVRKKSCFPRESPDIPMKFSL